VITEDSCVEVMLVKLVLSVGWSMFGGIPAKKNGVLLVENLGACII
jgi:hypothetical protein